MQISVFYNHIVEAAKQTGLSVDEVLVQVRGFGIEAVELDLDEARPDPEVLMQSLEAADMGVASMYAFFDFGNDPSVEPGLEFIDLAAYLEADKVLVIPGFIEKSASAGERNDALYRMAAALQEMCDYAAEHEITVTLEDFDDARAPFSGSEELLWFLEQVPALGCTFDTGNFIYRGEDELEAYSKLAPTIVHVHCKDRSLDEGNGGTPKITIDGKALFPSSVGAGIIRLEELISRLKADGYEDTFAIEHFDAVDQLSYMKQSAQWLRSRLAI
ncbi:sugar phosphate isomerase/epimerase family protein [Paenibacillus donghaensis]|uniref:Xylose isomerase n=1 Tax=Paenibacillus donghaensis TaxID=414771 RepID=A0A2Z2KCN2_9BACL|nr:sugar phosphate isomerase/epimerase [Paenibacillus donghaensis]ASA19719.1 xylose isomerase [Paenibacillus donghaensis]